MLSTIISVFSLSAQTFKDVVYLKNGSIIHGIIIEQVPNQTIKVQTNDGNVFVFNMAEIEKMTKEQIKGKNKNSKGNEGPTSGGHSFGNLNIAYIYPFDLPEGYKNLNLSLNLDGGYFIFENFAITTTIGFNNAKITYPSSTTSSVVPYTESYIYYIGTRAYTGYRTAYRTVYTSNPSYSSSVNSYTYGGGIRYYIAGKIFLGTSFISNKTKDFDAVSSVYFQAGYAFFINKNVALESAVSYIMGIGDYNGTAIQGKIGVGYYF